MASNCNTRSCCPCTGLVGAIAVWSDGVRPRVAMAPQNGPSSFPRMELGLKGVPGYMCRPQGPDSFRTKVRASKGLIEISRLDDVLLLTQNMQARQSNTYPSLSSEAPGRSRFGRTARSKAASSKIDWIPAYKMEAGTPTPLKEEQGGAPIGWTFDGDASLFSR